MNELTNKVLTSMEVAEMVDKEHKQLLKDIRKYTEQLGEGKISPTDFFTESTYTTIQNKTMPCYLVTKKGCEFIAHKLTGQKGTEFTARYINRFHEMEDEITTMVPEKIPVGEVARLTNVMDRVAVRQGLPPHRIAQNFNKFEQGFPYFYKWGRNCSFFIKNAPIFRK